MRPSNKSRSRNKNRRNNNNNSGGNILNRVYDSAGPDGRVRGTPQQVIEKYQSLTHDSSLAGDRVAMENFQQHAEHYVRLINEAQRQINERREQMEAQMQERNANNANNNNNNNNNNQQPRKDHGGSGEQPDVAQQPQPDVAPVEAKKPEKKPENGPVEAGDEGDSGLVETPESAPKKRAANPRPRKPRAPKPDAQPGGAPEAEAAE